MRSGRLVPLWRQEADQQTEALAAHLRALVAEANGRRIPGQRRRPASARSLGRSLFVAKTRINDALGARPPAIFDETLIVSIARECHTLCGQSFTAEVEEEWRHRVRAAATAEILASAADERLEAGSSFPVLRWASPGELLPVQRGRLLPVRRRWPYVAAAATVATALVVIALGEEDLVSLTKRGPACPDVMAIDAAASAGPAWASDNGPYLSPNPDRRVELHFASVSPTETVAWARLAASASPQDTVSITWSYVQDAPVDQERACVGRGRDTPAILVNDREGRMRWFRACADVPREDWAPGADHGSFCTGSQRPSGA